MIIAENYNIKAENWKIIEEPCINIFYKSLIYFLLQLLSGLYARVISRMVLSNYSSDFIGVSMK